jgi:hypothetical protein
VIHYEPDLEAGEIEETIVLDLGEVEYEAPIAKPTRGAGSSEVENMPYGRF